ncbi:S-layer homology domain-containing protein [Paenibacillus alkalitolerans]|uniref:S-layer homology domain-containing protein n=1 Tax=Paenibacillus alkalitolerans TaxID=2799335 RepID=UPI0018F30B83|nr:S-layer homology domain-containing protein [Paenibacillus alkalitolerans]
MAKKETLYKTSMNVGSGIFLKSSVVKKTAGLLVTMLLLSALMPVLAFAGVNFGNVTFKNGTVSGSVYVTDSVYTDVYDGKIWITINQSNGVSSVVYATYKESVSGVVYYDFKQESVTGATYVDLTGSYKSIADDVYYDSVTKRVYRSKSSGGGGIGYIPTGLADINGVVSASALIDAFKGKTTVEIEITGDVATLPASALAEIAKSTTGATVVIKNKTGSYAIPLSALNYDELAKELGSTLANTNITVQIKALTGDAAKPVTDAIAELGGKSAAPAVDFTVSAVGNNKTVAVKDFGSTYAVRTINADNAFGKNVTGVLYNPETKKLTFVPATFADKVATLKSTSNSIYTVVELDKSFSDVTGTWSEEYVESMANKLIVEGYETGLFQPNKAISRAEFAALVVRALGLSNKTATSNFSDVAAGAWYANAVAVAAEAGIIKGYGDDTFRPTAEISRKELAAMVVRASEYAGTKLAADTSALAAFKDASGLGWAEAEVSAAVKAGIVNGLSASVLAPNGTATRAEAATMLQRFLANAKFINE